MKDGTLWTRREILAIGTGVTGFLTAPGLAQVAERTFTQSMVAGPFYPQIKPLDQDSDLTIVNGRKTRAKGQIIHVAGRVTDIKGFPIQNAKVEIWQADANGRYSHRSDPNPAELDNDFQGYCILKTDTDGRYRFKSIMPGAYPGMRSGATMRTPHIHFEVHGRTDRLITQMFFPGEQLNATDNLLQSIRNPSARASLIAKQLPPTPDMKGGEIIFGWDIVLLTG